MARPASRAAAPARLSARAPFVVVGACALVLLTGNAQRIAVSPFLEDFRLLFGVDYAGVGALITAYLFGYALAQLPAGLAADRWDPRRVALVGLGGLGLGALV